MIDKSLHHCITLHYGYKFKASAAKRGTSLPFGVPLFHALTMYKICLYMIVIRVFLTFFLTLIKNVSKLVPLKEVIFQNDMYQISMSPFMFKSTLSGAEK